MDPETQIDAFESDLDNLIERYSKEYDLSIATLIGCLSIKTHMLCAEAGAPEYPDDGKD